MEQSDYDFYYLIPQYSELSSRKDISVETLFTKHHKINIPIVSSPMNTVTELEMAKAMAELGGLGIIHRYMTPIEQMDIVRTMKNGYNLKVGASIGINKQEERINLLTKYGVDVLTMDVAHGDMKQCHDLVRMIKKTYDVDVMSGNIVTPEAAERYYDAGVDCFRVGLGAGSGCITRKIAGVGYNQLLAIREIRERIKDVPIISDGGIRNSGDIVKCLAAGADTVFIGGLLSVAKESPAERVFINEPEWSGMEFQNNLVKKVKYFGMASYDAEKKRIERTGEDATDIIHFESPEGKVIYFEDSNEPAKTIVNRLISGVKIGFAYMGSKNITELQQKAQWVKV